jgi:hypothetical protein
MNISTAKSLIWVASLGVSGYLGFYVFTFYKARDVLAEPVSSERILGVLDSVAKPEVQRAGGVPYDAVMQVFHELDWTGKPPPPPPPPTTGTEVKPKVVPISSILKVLALSVNTFEPAKSLAVVAFVDRTVLGPNPGREDSFLRPGERLPGKYKDVRVESITPEGVVFAFDDETRAKETVAPPEYQSGKNIGIVVVGEGGAILPPKKSVIQRVENARPFTPGETTLIRKNEYQVGTKTLERLDEDYATILSRDVRYSTYRNPRTGSVEGIKVNHVAPNSLPAQHGLQEGEVLKSINGHPVTSVNDAVAYVKANSNTTSTWVAVFTHQGREFSRTYHSPGR